MVPDIFGFSEQKWLRAKTEAKAALYNCAAVEADMAYSELVTHIRTIRFEYHDRHLDALLEEISVEEDKAGRGMLSAIVVHKTGDKRPGPGFFKLAERLGRNISDRDACWIREVRKV